MLFMPSLTEADPAKERVCSARGKLLRHESIS